MRTRAKVLALLVCVCGAVAACDSPATEPGARPAGPLLECRHPGLGGGGGGVDTAKSCIQTAAPADSL